MSLIAVVGGTGAPGATTTALALTLTWPEQERGVLLVEGDPDGGAILPGALAGRIPALYGLHRLGLAQRQDTLQDEFGKQLIDLSEGAGRRLLLPGLTNPNQAASLAHTWEPLTRLLLGLEHGSPGYDVVVDLGRSGALGASGVLARRADVVLVVVRSTMRSVTAAEGRIKALKEDLDAHGTGADTLALCVVTQGKYPPSEAARILSVPLVAVLPYEPKQASVLSDGTGNTDRQFMRSSLMVGARTSARELTIRANTRRLRLGLVHPTSAGQEVSRAR